MPTFNIGWDNTSILTNDNITAVRVVYAISNTVGGWGAFISNAGITPANDILKTIKTATITITPFNTKIRVKVQSICSQGGPIDNEDGLEEGIVFQCITPTITNTHNSSTISINLSTTDITKVRLSVKRDSDNAVLVPLTIVNRANNAATFTATSLVAQTNYTWNIELYADLSVDGDVTTVISSDIKYLGVACLAPFKTANPPLCAPITSINVTAS
jgi:hypothetical protein